MSEQVFPSGDWGSDDERATALACDLLEDLIEAISRPEHDWPALRRRTGELNRIAAAMAAAHPAADSDRREQSDDPPTPPAGP